VFPKLRVVFTALDDGQSPERHKSLGKHLEFTFFSIPIKTGDQLVGLECT